MAIAKRKKDLNRKEEEVKFDFGNWWCPEYYSDEARQEKQKADDGYNHGKDYVSTKPEGKAAQKQKKQEQKQEQEQKRLGLADYYKGFPTDRVTDLMYVLVADVFCLPLDIQRRIRTDDKLLAPFNEDLYHVLVDVGGCGILNVSKVNAKHKVLKDAAEIGRHLYLTDEPVGMPVAKYLFYLLGGQVSSETLAEWSGVPMHRLEYVYRRIVNMLRMGTRSIHRHQLKHGQMPKDTEPVAKEVPAFDQYPFDPDAGNDI